jgi:hypothetical protein
LLTLDGNFQEQFVYIVQANSNEERMARFDEMASQLTAENK